jgi:DNA primase
MGTALTEAQLRLLKRFTQRFVLALDSDVAGDQATLRGLDVARQVADREVVPVPTPRGYIRFEERLAADIRIVSLPLGRDPDEVIRDSPARWAQMMAQAKPVMDYYFQALTADLDLGTARGKADAVRALGPLIAEVADRVQRNHYLQQLARMVQMDERSLWQQIRQTTSRTRPARRSRDEPPARDQEKAPLDLGEFCLSIFLCHPELLALADEVFVASQEAALEAEDLSCPEDRAIFAAWRQWLAGNGSPDARAEFFDTLDESLQDRVTLLIQAQEEQPPVADDLLKSDTLDTATRLRLRNLSQQIQDLYFLLASDQDSQSRSTYGPMIAKLATRKARLEKAMDGRSISGRRQREDNTIRLPFAEE